MFLFSLFGLVNCLLVNAFSFGRVNGVKLVKLRPIK